MYGAGEALSGVRALSSAPYCGVNGLNYLNQKYGLEQHREM